MREIVCYCDRCKERIFITGLASIITKLSFDQSSIFYEKELCDLCAVDVDNFIKRRPSKDRDRADYGEDLIKQDIENDNRERMADFRSGQGNRNEKIF